METREDWMAVPVSGETVYSRAADIIRERGWHQGDYAGVRAVCAHGALHAAEGFKPWECREVREARGGPCPAEAMTVRVGGIATWNDAPERTVEDVLLVLKELHVEAGGS